MAGPNTIQFKARDDPDSARLADAAVSQWHAIQAALAPIIGNEGVAALYDRSLHLSTKTHPWLDHQQSQDVRGMDLTALRTLLANRSPAEVSEASCTLSRAFMALLASLVGASLAERLLGGLWAPASDGTAAQDTSS